MLIAALAVTLVGFILLVIALVVSSTAFAWACIGVCIVGFVLLVVDIIRSRRAGGESGDDAPAAPEGEAGTESVAAARGGDDDAD